MTFLDQLLDMMGMNAQVEPEPKKVDESNPPIFDDIDQWLKETERFFNERSAE